MNQQDRLLVVHGVKRLLAFPGARVNDMHQLQHRFKRPLDDVMLTRHVR
jgi:hypothetical protein